MAFSDFKIAERFERKHSGFEGILNVIEDARIEQQAMERWPGVQRNLDMMFEQIRPKAAALVAQRSPFERFCTAVYLKLAHYGDMLGLQGELAGFEDLLDEFPQVGTTSDAAALAEKVLERWRRQAAEARQEASGAGSQASGTPEGEPPGRGGNSAGGGARPQRSKESASAGGTSGHRDNSGGGEARPESRQSANAGGPSGRRHPQGDDQAMPESSGESGGDGKPAGYRRNSAHGRAKSPSPNESPPARQPNTDAGYRQPGRGGKKRRSRPAPGAADRQPGVEPKSPLANSGGQEDGKVPDSAAKGAQMAPGRLRGDGQDSGKSPGLVGHGAGGVPGSLIGEALAEAISEQIAQVNATGQYRPFTREFDRIEVIQPAGEAEVQALLATGRDTVRRLRRGLTNALRSAEKRWWRDDQTRGHLSPRTLYRLATDRCRLDVFRVRSMVQGKSTAVSIVLDASGSMTTRKMEVAREAMRVLLEALADLKVATEAFTFTTGDAVDCLQALQQTGLDAGQLRERYGRLSNLEIGLIKRFDESVKEALRRLPGIRGTGLTPLGEAMQIGAARLSPRPENRKILLVLTDGKAGCEGLNGAAATHARDVARLIGKAGIELVGVGIQDNSVCTIVKDSIVIHVLADLPAQMCKLLGRTLKKGVCHVG